MQGLFENLNENYEQKHSFMFRFLPPSGFLSMLCQSVNTLEY